MTDWMHTYVWHTSLRWHAVEQHESLVRVRVGETVEPVLARGAPPIPCTGHAVHGYFWLERCFSDPSYRQFESVSVHLCVLSTPKDLGYRLTHGRGIVANDLRQPGWRSRHVKVGGKRRQHLGALKATRAEVHERTRSWKRHFDLASNEIFDEAARQLLVEQGFEFPIEWGRITITDGPTI